MCIYVYTWHVYRNMHCSGVCIYVYICMCVSEYVRILYVSIYVNLHVHICNYKYTCAYVRMYIWTYYLLLPHIEVNQLEWDWFSRQLMRFILNLQSSGLPGYLADTKKHPVYQNRKKRCQSGPQKKQHLSYNRKIYKLWSFLEEKTLLLFNLESCFMKTHKTPPSCRVVARNVLPSNFSSDSNNGLPVWWQHFSGTIYIASDRQPP